MEAIRKIPTTGGWLSAFSETTAYITLSLGSPIYIKTKYPYEQPLGDLRLPLHNGAVRGWRGLPADLGLVEKGLHYEGS